MLQITVDMSVPPVNCTFLRSGAMTYVPGSEWVGNKCLYWLLADGYKVNGNNAKVLVFS